MRRCDGAGLNREHDQSGKCADFAILEEDPYVADPIRLKDIRIWGTALSGNLQPVKICPWTRSVLSTVALATFIQDRIGPLPFRHSL